MTPLTLSTRQRPVDLCESEASLVYIVSSRTARASQGNPVLKRTITKIKNKRKRRLEADVSSTTGTGGGKDHLLQKTSVTTEGEDTMHLSTESDHRCSVNGSPSDLASVSSCD